MPIEPVNSIQSNLSAQRAARVLNENTLLLQKSLARLSSGLRIISPSDDPGGLAVSIRLNNEITRATAAQTNISNATSYSETQSGFLTQVADALDRMSELAGLSQDELATAAQRTDYQTEFSELQLFVSDVATKKFDGISLFSSTNLPVTVDGDGGTFTLNTTHFTDPVDPALGGGLETLYNTSNGQSVSTTTAAATAEALLTTAINNLGLMQAKVGANITRLNLTSDNLTVLNDNLGAASDRITVVDVPTETTEFTRLQLLVDAGTTMLAEANTRQKSLLDLLKFS